MKARNLIQSFSFAADGVLHVLRTQRNMRIHFLVAAGILVLAGVLHLSREEIILLLISISFVLITEILNTTVEIIVDMITNTYHPLARAAKNVAAGAVLVAAVNSVVVGWLVFADKVRLVVTAMGWVRQAL